MRILSTLNPEKMGVQDITDISGRGKVTFTWLSDDPVSPSANGVVIAYKVQYQGRKRVNHAFPRDTHGFLYFRRSARSHVAAGEIRFRVVRKEDRSLPFHNMFSQGSDLVSYDGFTPWRLSFIRIFKYFPRFRRLLLKDGFIKSSEEDELEGLLKGARDRGKSQILESIADPFPLRVGTLDPCFTILHEEKIFSGQVPCYFCATENYYRKGEMRKVEPPSSGKRYQHTVYPPSRI